MKTTKNNKNYLRILLNTDDVFLRGLAWRTFITDTASYHSNIKFKNLIYVSIFIFLFSVNARTQTAQVQGKVQFVQPDGTTVPLSGARIEPHTIEKKGRFSVAITDKKGIFNFAGLPHGNSYLLCISAPTVMPICYPNVKAGMTDILITVVKGNGNILTEDEIEQIRYKIVNPLQNTGGFATLSGTLKMIQQGDKPPTPIEDAKVKIIRTDVIEGKIAATKTNKRGEFTFTKLPPVGVYLICVSAPSTYTFCRKDAKVGTEGIVFFNGPGDGRETTDDEMVRLTVNIKYYLAKDYYNEKRYDLAIPVFTEALKLDPDHVASYHYRGHSYSALQKFELAVADFTSALKYDPEDTHYLNDRASSYAYWSNTKFELALTDLAKALKIKSNDARPYLLRARIFCAQGKKALAAADEKDAVSLGGEVREKCQQ